MNLIGPDYTIDHVAIAVRDLEDGLKWYCGCLGFEVIERRVTTGKKTSMISAVVKAGSTVIVLIQGTTPESQVSRFIEKFGPGVQHMALAVADLDEALKHVKQEGGAPDIETIEGPGIRQVFLRRDPGSGVRVELIERKGGQFTDKSVQKLFQAFEDRNLY